MWCLLGNRVSKTRFISQKKNNLSLSHVQAIPRNTPKKKKKKIKKTQIRLERENLRYIVKFFSSMESTISNLDFNIEEEELKRMNRRKTEK